MKLVVLLMLLGGCTLPIRSEDVAPVIDKLAQSNASACVVAGARGGGGAVPIAPVAVPSGGYGSAEFILGRSNEPGSKLKITPEGCEIEHGHANDKEIKERLDTLEAAFRLLLQHISEAGKGTAARYQ